VLVFLRRPYSYIAWIGATDLEAEFVITDEETGQPIPGATIQFWQLPPPFVDKNKEFTLVTDEAGRVKKFFENCGCTGHSGWGVDTFNARLPFGHWRVEASGYEPAMHEWFIVPVSPEKRGPPFAKLTINITLEKKR
jgi:hypothetical protein